MLLIEPVAQVLKSRMQPYWTWLSYNATWPAQEARDEFEAAVKESYTSSQLRLRFFS